jgi:hypothetical protein
MLGCAIDLAHPTAPPYLFTALDTHIHARLDARFGTPFWLFLGTMKHRLHLRTQVYVEC